MFASALGVGFTLGMAAPLISLALEQRGADPMTIGLNAAMPALAMLAAGPVVPAVIGVLGPLGAMAAGLSLSVLMLVLFPVLDLLPAWFLLRFVIGVGMALHWTASETWVNRLATEAGRGRMVALYASLWGAGIAGGPQVMALTGITGPLPFVVAAAMLALALAALAVAHGVAPTLPVRPRRDFLPRVWRMAPTALVAALVCGLAETNIFALLPLYALRQGLDETATLALLTAFSVGNLALQLPLGWLADRFDRGRVLMGCALAALGIVLALPLAIGTPAAVWPLLFVLGGLSAGFYTLSLTLIGQRFDAADLAGANVAIIMAYTAGMVAGPVLGGVAMGLWNPHGLMVVLALVFAGAIPVLASRRVRPTAET